MPRIKKKQNIIDDQFVPNFEDLKYGLFDDKKLKQKKKQRKMAMLERCQNHCEGPWSKKQNEIYMNFLLENRQSFENEYLRRSKKVFYRLSEVIPQRTPEQCRSHHQKVQQQSQSQNLDEIIKYISQRILIKQKKNVKQTLTDIQTRLNEVGFVIEKKKENRFKITINKLMLDNWQF